MICFPENFPEAKSKGKHWGEGETELTVPPGPVIKCIVIPPNPKIEENSKEIVCLTPAGLDFLRSLVSFLPEKRSSKEERGLLTFPNSGW